MIFVCQCMYISYTACCGRSSSIEFHSLYIWISLFASVSTCHLKVQSCLNIRVEGQRKEPKLVILTPRIPMGDPYMGHDLERI
jgi:hypothetical protein